MLAPPGKRSILHIEVAELAGCGPGSAGPTLVTSEESLPASKANTGGETDKRAVERQS